jgi:hypothetical protein
MRGCASRIRAGQMPSRVHDSIVTALLDTHPWVRVAALHILEGSDEKDDS